MKELYICNNAQNCLCEHKKDCPHSVPHEKRDDDLEDVEAYCFGVQVKSIRVNKSYSPFEDSLEYHESFA